MKQLLDAIFELVRLFLADVLQPWAVMRQRLHAHGAFQERVVYAVQFQREEEEVRRSRRDLVLRIAVKFSADGIGRIARVNETRIGHDAPEQILDLFILTHGRSKFFARVRRTCNLRQLAAPLLAKCLADLQSPFDVGLERRRLHAGIEVIEVPFRQ